METREILLKADKVSVVFERIEGGKIRATTSSWDDAKVLLSTVADALEAAADVAASGGEAAAAVYRGARASSARPPGRPSRFFRRRAVSSRRARLLLHVLGRGLGRAPASPPTTEE